VIGKVGEEVMRSIKIAGLILGVCLVAVLPAMARGGHYGGRIAVFPSFGYWGWYNPYYYGYYGPYGYYPSMYSNLGEIRLKTNVKDADVYINGAYAGKADKLKTMYVRPDSYSLEIRAPGQPPVVQKLYVVAGKTVKVQADFSIGGIR
jgi:hypothetical protein